MVTGGGAVASASPAALAAVGRAGAAASADLTRCGRRLSAALTGGARFGVPAWASWLGEDVGALADAWEGLDRWVGRVGAAFDAADAGLIGPPAPVQWLPESSPLLASVGDGPT